MRAASLVVTDRRWAAPLSAMALGFGLFIGVAIGPGAAGTLAPAPSRSSKSRLPTRGDERRSRGGGGGTAPPPSPAVARSDGQRSAFPRPHRSPANRRPAAPAESPHRKRAEPARSRRREENGTEETLTLAGTVVHANPAAGSYTLAMKGGELVSVHAARLPVPAPS